MLTLSITATFMKYMVRYMVGVDKSEGDLANAPKGGADIVTNMLSFSPDDSTWDDSFTWDGQGDYIDRYDDNYGNFCDVQNNAIIAVRDVIPIDETLAPDTKIFLYWVVDENENVYCQKSHGEIHLNGNSWVDDDGCMVDQDGYLLSETRRVPYKVNPNRAIQLKDYNDFAISLGQDLGGAANGGTAPYPSPLPFLRAMRAPYGRTWRL